MHAIAHGSVRTRRESLNWWLTLGEKSLAAPGNRTCVGSVPVRCSTNWATSLPMTSVWDAHIYCGSTSFPWLVFFFAALLWWSMIHKHTGRFFFFFFGGCFCVAYRHKTHWQIDEWHFTSSKRLVRRGWCVRLSFTSFTSAVLPSDLNLYWTYMYVDTVCYICRRTQSFHRKRPRSQHCPDYIFSLRLSLLFISHFPTAPFVLASPSQSDWLTDWLSGLTPSFT